MKKKILTISLVVCLAVITAAGTSLAYLTDKDSAENIFTFGNVEIELNETFEDNALIPGKKLTKEATITNTGINDAWVWITVAIPTELDGGKDASKNILHMNIPGRNWLGYQDNRSFWAEGQTVATPKEQCWKADAYESTTEIKGVKYTVYTHLYNGILTAEEETTTCLSSVYLDSHIDIDPDGNLFWVEKGEAVAIDWNIAEDGAPSVYVSAYAIQAEGFKTVEDAYAAYQNQWGDNGTEYGKTLYPATEVE